MTGSPVITVNNLQKHYGEVKAINGISFEVRKGEIFGMVGPNGAGKTTTIECIEGLRLQDSGSISILGLDPQKNHYELVESIGIQLQQSQVQARLKVRETLELYSSFYSKKVDISNLINLLDLKEKENTYFDKLSGGQKQRLFIALALVNDPEVVFLDELTTGLDPQARRNMWDLVRSIREQDKTVFLTTHFMEEAERLCDRVAIVDRGEIVALDTPEELIRGIGAEDRVEFRVDGDFDISGMNRLKEVTKIEQIDGRNIAYGKSDRLVVEIVMYLAENNIKFRDLRSERPTLEDVFLTLTGREMRD
ncbi:ABC transporter ATP-binding protein [candidate division KSB1 bacterium]